MARTCAHVQQIHWIEFIHRLDQIHLSTVVAFVTLNRYLEEGNNSPSCLVEKVAYSTGSILKRSHTA